LRPAAVFRVDASVEIGSGHARRCLTLARALGQDWDCFFAGRAGTVEVVPALARAGVAFIDLPDGVDEAERLRATLPAGCDLLVVDHYSLDAKFESACRGWARRIAVLDDLANRRHDCDVLVDQTPSRPVRDYEGLVPEECIVLAGATYALLDSRFRQGSATAHAVPDVAKNVLINFGGTDGDGMTSLALESVSGVNLGLRTYYIVLDSRNARIGQVRALAQNLPGSEIMTDVDDMAALLGRCDMALGAGGVSSLERCCIGLPSLIVQVADNQRGNATALSAAGAARDLGPARHLKKGTLADELVALSRNRELRRSMSVAGKSLVDGRGAERVAAICRRPVRAKDGRTVNLRRADSSDSDIMLEWQSAPGIRAYSRHPHPPDRQSHEKWLDAKLRDPNCVLTVIELDGTPAGVLRLDRLETEQMYEVSILVAPGQQGRGVGGAALDLAAHVYPAAEMRATISQANAASIRMFERHGYKSIGNEEWRLPPRQG
jgi:UDP-2,4-diacetamido-2,4,6-trideoxy-beta-L-altropyranose hydrolase